MPTSRRQFLATSAAAAAVPYFAWNQKAFANDEKNDRPNIGCIGVGSMGTGDARGHAHFGDVVAVCDVDMGHARRAKNDDNIGKGKADMYEDYRKVLDRDDIDVVSIVTPDHWHVKIAIEALQAGKHVFCQKPLTLTLEENQLIRNACKKYPDLVFTVGTQQRSQKDLFLRAVNMVQKGLLGDITKVTAGINGSPTGGPFKAVVPPADLDWYMWLGQAPLTDYMEKRCHYEFRWWYEYSGGKFTDWGAHHVDIATWALDQQGEGKGPVEVDGTDANHPVPFENGYPTVDNKYNTSHDFDVVCKYDNGTVLHVTSRGENGILFEGTKGRIFVNRGKITGKPIEEKWDEGEFTTADVEKLYKGKPYEGHKSNFYRCIREGGQPVSDVFSHVQAMNICHLSSVASRLNRKINWDPKAEQITGDDQAATFFARRQRPGFEIPRIEAPGEGQTAQAS
ncbi:Gfo/Idh/MocA family oxidoreductase [Aeoliella sp. ICT_H6.2]|uniref:Gfo/Idh/MocA family oxidoreductase n=1 Tax=Aeoliella straminimaris TaxID=2954799 RepID=A0A9X2F8Q3_9BACT|nr:Gfo/Idh/MocA family oxidoreductase [Aeoliella straminimaris]MCO6043914.1 Gfo/Idh/MocA family oxidoreductase [Aeoliella straminimaris]